MIFLSELNAEISTLTEVKQRIQKITEKVLRKRAPKFCFLRKKRLEAALTFTEDFWNKCSSILYLHRTWNARQNPLYVFRIHIDVIYSNKNISWRWNRQEMRNSVAPASQYKAKQCLITKICHSNSHKCPFVTFR